MYVCSTSTIRMFMVCALTMAAPFGSMIMIELIPLASPSAGWAENWGFWIRKFVNLVWLTTFVSILVQAMAPSAPFTVTKILIVAVTTSSGVLVELLLLASNWKFPIPFTDLLNNLAWQFLLWISVMLTLGLKNTLRVPAVMNEFLLCERMILLQGSLLVIYPAYSSIFASLKGEKQVAFTIMLPVVKFSMKHFMSRLRRHTDTSLMLAKATVDTFEALFIFKCMQAATSWMSVLTLGVVDFLQSALHIHSFYQFNRNEMRMANFISRLTLRAKNRISSSVARKSSLQDTTMQDSIVNKIVPVTSAGSQIPAQDPHHVFFLHCREVLLIKFIEFAITAFYLVYLIILFHLPSAKYYPEMTRMTNDNKRTAFKSIGTYAFLQSMSLLVMHWFLIRRFNISALHLLAFTLEKKGVVLHAAFNVWVHTILQISLDHNGRSAIKW